MKATMQIKGAVLHRYIVFFSVLLLLTQTGFGQSNPDVPDFARFKKDKEAFMARRAEAIGLRRGIEKDKPFDPAKRIAAVEQMESQKFKVNSSAGVSTEMLSLLTSWTEIGPNPIPNGQVATGPQLAVSGRTTSIAVHPTNPDIVYVGTAQGGLYRSLNGGTTWTPMLDNALSLAVNTVAIAPSQPNTIFVGTGESGFSADSYFGVGIYRIDNANSANPTITGPIGGTVFAGRSVSKIVVHPTDPNIIFAGSTSGVGGIGGVQPIGAANRGIFRSIDAMSAAPSFTKLTITGLAAQTRNVVDIVMDPGNPDLVLLTIGDSFNAGEGGVYRSTNALAVSPTFVRTFAAGVGTEASRTELALNRNAGVVTVYAASGFNGGTVQRSVDGGATWTERIDNNFCTPQCFYDIAVAVDPIDATRVYIGGSPNLVFGISTNGGTTFTNNATTASGLHVDSHAIGVSPSDPTIIYFGSDGGIYKSTTTGTTWVSLNNTTFRATQFMSLAVHPIDPNFTIGGTQDNGTNFFKPDGTWTRADFGDGGYSLIDQGATDNVTVNMYHTYFNAATLQGYGVVTTTASATEGNWAFRGCNGSAGNGIPCNGAVLFYAPIEQGPGSPNTVYYGANILYRSADRGLNHTAVSQNLTNPISAIGISPQNDNVRIVGQNSGGIFGTTTGSTTLTNLDAGNAVPNNFVARAVIDPNNVNTAYVTLSAFGVVNVWKTTTLNNVNPTWTSAASGIPQVPVNAFVVDPANSNRLFAGTDIGVYASLDGGATWNPFGTGLPVVAVFDMAIQPVSRVLRIATHGRGMWQASVCDLPDVPTLSTTSATNCGAQATTLSIQTGALNGAASWQWYTGSCGGTPAGSGTSIMVSPNSTTQYFVRGEGGCVASPGACASITINVNTPQNWYLDADGDGYYTGTPISACSSPGIGYTTTVTGGNDCDDSNPAIHNANIDINVKGNTLTIVDGDATPDVADHTDFGSINTGGNIVRTFTVENAGTASLAVGAITMTGAHPSMFAVGPLTPASPILTGGSATFTVTFNPASLGLKTATVNIANDDCDETNYDFAIQGTGTPAVTCPALTTRLYVDASAAPGGTGAAWACALQQLSTAITMANGNMAIKSIWVADGTYKPGASRTDVMAITRADLMILGGFAGGEANAMDANPAVNQSIISGDIGVANDMSDNSYRLMNIGGSPVSASPLVVDGFVFENGNANGAGDRAVGAAILSNGIPVTTPVWIKRSLFRNNNAVSSGGAVYLTGANLAFDGCRFVTNTAGSAGGAVFSFQASPAFTNSVFVGNTAPNGGGYYGNYGYPTFNKTAFSGNSATYGGGVYQNRMGADYFNCVFNANTSFQGGAIYEQSASTSHILNSTFFKNTGVSYGGTIVLTGSNSSTVTENSIFWKNTHGGSATSPWADFVNYTGGANVYANNILQLNTAVPADNGTTRRFNKRGVDPLFTNELSPVGADIMWGTADDGLQLQDCAPPAGPGINAVSIGCSPAINAGDNTPVGAAGLTTDERNLPRIVCSIVDMGAYENQNCGVATGAEEEVVSMAKTITTNGVTDIVANPFANELQIRYTGAEKAGITVYAASGKTMWSKTNITEGITRINSSSWARGMYQVVIVTANGKRINFKVVRL